MREEGKATVMEDRHLRHSDVRAGTREDVESPLVEALRRDDPDAPDKLVERYATRLYRLAIRITGVEQDAEEVAQDTL